MDANAPRLPLADASPESASTSPASTTCTRLEWLEANMPGELARAFLLGRQFARAEQNVHRCYDRYGDFSFLFGDAWVRFHSLVWFMRWPCQACS